MNSRITDSRVQISIDLDQAGRQIGELKIKWSDNRQPIGHYPVPIACLAHGTGPTLLLVGGVHGDEFEGPAAIMRLLQKLSVEDLLGRVIMLPALNAAAVKASSRVSPLDHINLNRAFPGDADGSPTQMLAHFIESELLPQCDAVIDLHSGGKASIFAPCVLTQIDSDSENRLLAEAFGAPYIWMAGEQNDDRSLNAAAARQQVSMIAAELGGGGGCDPEMTDFAERALMRCLQYLKIVDTKTAVEKWSSRYLRMDHSLNAPARGLFDLSINIGDEVESGQSAGCLHFIDEPERPSQEICFASGGIILAVGNRGMVERGDLIALVAKEVNADGGFK